ncbi:MAG: hypothetical protein R2718_02535 [Solirubrobacterales bacterium]|nr:hypothetical protein [Solirubrobacterales bacterium]
MSEDYGTAIHYTAVERGTPVYDNGGEKVGEVRRVEDNYAEHILDGFEIIDLEGTLRFVDAPEVSRTFERAVILTISAAELPERAHAVNRGLGGIAGGDGGQPGGLLGRIFGR